MTPENDTKSIAKDIGRALKAAGHDVPHSVLLHAVSAALGQTNWHVLKQVAARHGTDAEPPARASGDAPPVVAARFYTDDRRIEFEFDAAPWLEQTDAVGFRAVLEDRHNGPHRATDAIAYWMEGRKDPRFVRAFDYLQATNAANPDREMVGFAVCVDAAACCAWLRQHRPEVLALILCSHFGVQVTPAQESALRGQWRWHDGEGNVCRGALRNREQAYLDAMESLALVDRFLRSR